MLPPNLCHELPCLQVAAEVERARVAAEAQARIEVEALAARMREMEDFVERADAARLDMAGKVSELSAALKAVKRDESESYDLVKEAEERADGLQVGGWGGVWADEVPLQGTLM